MSPSERRYDLDWLRILAVLLLIPFHGALIFVMDPNSIMYIKDTVGSPFLDQAASFVHQWHMPLFFAISGAASCFALRARSGRDYLKERFTRLLIPFLFGVIVLIPPTTYIRFIGQPGATSLLAHYIRFFTADPGDLSGFQGTFTPAHLWFILFLFVFSLAGLPFFIFLRSSRGQQLVRALAKACRIPALLLLWGLPLALAAALDLLGDKNPLVYFLIFFYGYLLASDAQFSAAIDRQTGLFLLVGLAASTVHIFWPDDLYPEFSLPGVLSGLLYVLGRWSWVLAILGLGRRFLNGGHPILRYAGEAAYPFYILHMTLTVLAGYVAIRLNIGTAAKYTLIVSLATLATLAVYELLVRRINPLRFLFGMKPLVKPAKSAVLRPVIGD